MLAIVNKAAVNMSILYLNNVLISFPLDKYQEVGLLDHTVLLLCFLRKLHTVYIPTNSPEVFPFLISSPILVSCLSDDRHGNRSEMLSHCDFGLHFPSD